MPAVGSRANVRSEVLGDFSPSMIHMFDTTTLHMPYVRLIRMGGVYHIGGDNSLGMPRRMTRFECYIQFRYDSRIRCIFVMRTMETFSLEQMSLVYFPTL